MTDNTSDSNSIGRRTYLLTASGIAAAGTIGLAGCLDGGTARGDGTDNGDEDDELETGTLATMVASSVDHVDDFERCTVTVEGLWVKPLVDSEDDESGDGDDETGESNTGDADPAVDTSDDRDYHEFDDPHEIDLVPLVDGETEALEAIDLEIDEYAFLQLDVGGVAAEIDGEDVTVVVSEDPLQFDAAFEIRAEETTTVVAALAPVYDDEGDEYRLAVLADDVEIEYEDGETDEHDEEENGTDAEDGDSDETADDGDADENGGDDVGDGDGDTDVDDE